MPTTCNQYVASNVDNKSNAVVSIERQRQAVNGRAQDEETGDLLRVFEEYAGTSSSTSSSSTQRSASGGTDRSNSSSPSRSASGASDAAKAQAMLEVPLPLRPRAPP